MKAYDIPCPVCGTMNHGLFLQETDGCMECENCGNECRVLTLRPLKVVQLYQTQQRPVIGGCFAVTL